MDLDMTYNYLAENFDENVLEVLTGIYGYNEETLNNYIYYVSGYHNIKQYLQYEDYSTYLQYYDDEEEDDE